MGFYLFMGITVNTRLLLFFFFFRLLYVHPRRFFSGVEWRRRGQRETKWATNLLVLSVPGCSSGGTLKEQQVKVWGILMDECLSRRGSGGKEFIVHLGGSLGQLSLWFL